MIGHFPMKPPFIEDFQLQYLITGRYIPVNIPLNLHSIALNPIKLHIFPIKSPCNHHDWLCHFFWSLKATLRAILLHEARHACLHLLMGTTPTMWWLFCQRFGRMMSNIYTYTYTCTYTYTYTYIYIYTCNMYVYKIRYTHLAVSSLIFFGGELGSSQVGTMIMLINEPFFLVYVV